MLLTRTITCLFMLSCLNVAVAGDEVPEKSSYVSLRPPFILNLNSTRGSRYMQIKMQVSVDSNATGDKVKYHMPVVRNTLILFFSDKTVPQARSVKTREQWRAEALEETQKALTEVTGSPLITGLYFTDFVVQ